MEILNPETRSLYYDKSLNVADHVDILQIKIHLYAIGYAGYICLLCVLVYNYISECSMIVWNNITFNRCTNLHTWQYYSIYIVVL